jgi:hypothetical protein
MNPFSHYLLAERLEATLQPVEPGAYYLGAIIPDIRYLAGIPRQQTHLSQAQIRAYRQRYPDLSAFLLGYQVHCLLDEIELTRIVGGAFPLSLLRKVFPKRFTRKPVTVLTELYFLQRGSPGWRVQETHNPILDELGIQSDQTGVFLRALKQYFLDPSPESAAASLQSLGFVESSRFEKYFKDYQLLERQRLLKAFLLSGVKNSQIEEFALKYVLRRIAEEQRLAPAG